MLVTVTAGGLRPSFSNAEPPAGPPHWLSREETFDPPRSFERTAEAAAASSEQRRGHLHMYVRKALSRCPIWRASQMFFLGSDGVMVLRAVC